MECDLRDWFSSMQAELQVNHHDEQAQERVGEVLEPLKTLQNKQAEGQRIRSLVKWKKVGDSCAKEFFRAATAYRSYRCFQHLLAGRF